MQSTRTIHINRSTLAASFLSTHLHIRTKAQLVHACLHKIYPRIFFEQEALRALTELNAIEITYIACARITTRDFPSSLNRAVPQLHGFDPT